MHQTWKKIIVYYGVYYVYKCVGAVPFLNPIELDSTAKKVNDVLWVQCVINYNYHNQFHLHRLAFSTQKCLSTLSPGF